MGNDEAFDFLSEIYIKNGFHLYMIGGTSRDFLLGQPYSDLDFCTDATPEDEKGFLPDADYTFAKYGSIKVRFNNFEADVTTLRQEGMYLDSRHPSKITFVKDPLLDYPRRDFTINAIYLSNNYKVIDYCGGLMDLKEGIIRFIGNADKRIKEDPLRILRALRFKEKLGFRFDKETELAVEANRNLISELNPEKVKMELMKGKKL